MGLKRYHFHREAASAPISTLAAEIKRVRTLIKECEERDVFDFDESALFWMLVPDIGLSTRQMAGVQALQATIDRFHQRAPSITPSSTTKFTELDSNVSTEQEWTDEEIVDQVTAEMQHADADARGQTLYDDDMDDVGAEDTPNVAAMAPLKPLSHTDALQSIRALRDYVAGLNNPHLEANLSFLSGHSTQLSTL
ncbi:hypothetical protein FRC09_018852 [Ceratobasidium sp. 395]|nr:hypothetical protein FRC09_018852 [Ceratobasidium sp. 395]